MGPPRSSAKALAYRWITNPKVARRAAQANDVMHYGILAFMATGFHFVGPVWHALFIFLVVRSQLAFRGCPLTKLSNFLREISGTGEETSKVFRQGITAAIYQKHGKKALPLILAGWLIVIFIQNLALHLLGW